jgi:hypothetical protein
MRLWDGTDFLYAAAKHDECRNDLPLDSRHQGVYPAQISLRALKARLGKVAADVRRLCLAAGRPISNGL